MKKLFRTKLKSCITDQSGVSLLEVIIAVSIFSIAAITLLQGFVTSGRVNKKSNLYLEATSTAQNIMEEIKSKRFEEVSLAFNYPIDLTTGNCRLSFLQPKISEISSGALGVREMLKENEEYTDVSQYIDAYGDDVSKVTASVISKDGGKTYEFNPRKKGTNASKYYFELTNVTNNHETFDALIEFDGSKDTEYKKKTNFSEEEGINDYLAPNIAKLDTRSNGFLIMGRDWDRGAMESLLNEQLNLAEKLWNEKYTEWFNSCPKDEKDENGEPVFHPTAEEIADYERQNPKPSPLVYEDVYNNTKRSLFVKLESSSGRIIAKAGYTMCAYDYIKEGGSEFETMKICPCGGRYAEMTESERQNVQCCCTYESAYTTFYGSEADEVLERIYVFYYPNYNSKSTEKPLDQITFDNEINYPLDLYVVKQREEEENGVMIPDHAQEMNYRMSLTIKEDPEGREKSVPNWNVDLSLYKAMTRLRTNLDYDISDITNIPERMKVNQSKLIYQDKRGRTASSIGAKNVLSWNGLDDREAKDRIYTAKVSIYKQGAAAKNFPEDERIVSLDGAKED